ncbi:MAG: hypothetical protein ACE5KE_15940 [Methanosarcinales archaeon]
MRTVTLMTKEEIDRVIKDAEGLDGLIPDEDMEKIVNTLNRFKVMR